MLLLTGLSFFYSDEYDAVIVCLGARVDMVAELSGVLPLRTCRGIVAHLQLHDSFRYEVML